MRVTTNQIYQNSLNGILENQKKLLRAQDVIVKQSNILKPSDDPAGATKVVRLDEDLGRLKQFEKNTVLLKNSLSNKETALTSVNDSLTRARTLTINVGNGSLSHTDRKAIAAELSLIKDEMADLLNTKNTQGEYIFAGSKSSAPPFVEDATGSYVYQGDENVKKIQISETLKLESGVPGSGFGIFEDTDATSTATISGASTATGSYDLFDQDTYEAFHNRNYVAVPPNPAGSNDYSIQIIAGSNYQVVDNGGTVLDTGPFDTAGTGRDSIRFAGLDFDISGGLGDQLDFSLDPPNKKNVLNSMDDLVNLLNSQETTDDNFLATLQATIYSLDQSQENISNARSELGGRMNVVDSVSLSNTDLEINLKEAKAKISEVDFSEAISDLQKHETALQAAHQIYTKVTGLSLMNFIR